MDETNVPNIEPQSTIMNPEAENFLVHELTKEEKLENEDRGAFLVVDTGETTENPKIVIYGSANN